MTINDEAVSIIEKQNEVIEDLLARNQSLERMLSDALDAGEKAVKTITALRYAIDKANGDVVVH